MVKLNRCKVSNFNMYGNIIFGDNNEGDFSAILTINLN